MDGRVVPVLRPTVERSLLALRDMRRLRESCEDARRAVDGVLPFDYAALGFDDGGVDEQQLLEDNIAITDIALLSARDRLCWHKARLPAAPGRHPFDRPSKSLHPDDVMQSICAHVRSRLAVALHCRVCDVGL